MGSTAKFTKDPSAILDYQINWAAWLGTDTIVTSTWTLPAGITKTTDTKTTTTTTIWLSGGTAGAHAQYSVVNTITTAAGRTEQRTLKIVVEDR